MTKERAERTIEKVVLLWPYGDAEPDEVVVLLDADPVELRKALKGWRALDRLFVRDQEAGEMAGWLPIRDWLKKHGFTTVYERQVWL